MIYPKETALSFGATMCDRNTSVGIQTDVCACFIHLAGDKDLFNAVLLRELTSHLETKNTHFPFKLKVLVAGYIEVTFRDNCCCCLYIVHTCCYSLVFNVFFICVRLFVNNMSIRRKRTCNRSQIRCMRTHTWPIKPILILIK